MGGRARALPAAGLDRRAHGAGAHRRSRSSWPACPSATSSAWAPTCWRASCRGSTRRCSRRSARTRTPGARRSSSAPRATAWSRCWHACSAWTAASGPATRSTPDGLLTGRIVEPFVYGEGKVAAMQRFADEHDIDLAESWAYSDSASDLPMLRAVGNPVAVNPGRRAGEDRRRRGLARDAVREARQAAGDRRRHGGGGGQRHPAGDAPQAVARRLRARRAAAPLSDGRHRTLVTFDVHRTSKVISVCQARVLGASSAPRLSGMAVEPGARRRAHEWLQEVYSKQAEREAPFETISGRAGEAPLHRRTTSPTGTPSATSATPASTPTRAASTRRCTAGGCGRCASSRASGPPRRPTSASATCSTTARPGLSTAFDMPTLMGLDSDHARSPRRGRRRGRGDRHPRRHDRPVRAGSRSTRSPPR